MERLRLPFFVIAALALLLVVILEAGSNQCAALLVTVAHGQPAHPPGAGIPCLALLDGLLLFTIVLMGAAMLIGNRLHAKLQGVATLIVAIIAILGAIVLVIATVMLLLMMIALLLAVPFGTIAYLALYGAFDTGSAQAILALALTLKLVAGAALALDHQRFLQNKGLVLIIITSLVANVVVSFLQNIVPTPIVSITDAVAGIIVLILVIIWAVVLAIASLPAIVKALDVVKSS